jgi:uncharacterized protein
MIDFHLITGFDWDSGNSRKNADKHDFSQWEAEQVFFNQLLLVLLDAKHRAQKQRMHALGRTDDRRFLHISFTRRNDRTLIRVISARDMSRGERTHYEQAI